MTIGVLSLASHIPVANWANVPIGAGGVIQRIDISNDGTKVCASDISGGYICDNSNIIWKNLITPSNFSTFGGTTFGPWDIRIASGNSNIIYMAYSDGFCYRSADRGLTWTKMAFTQFAGFNGGGNTDTNSSPYRTTQQHLVIDPANPNVVYFGSNTAAGTQVTYDGGVTCGTISGITLATSTLISVTGASSGIGSVVRLTIASTVGLVAGAQITVAGVGGTTEANGVHIISAVGAGTIDLSGVPFVHAYTSGGTVNAPGPGGSGLCVDPSGGTSVLSGTVNGCTLSSVTVTKNIFVPVWGVGIFLSTDAGQNFSQISDGTGGNPLNVWNAGVVNTGTYAGTYICNQATAFGSGGAIWKYASGSWTNLTKSAAQLSFISAICIDQNNSGHIVFITSAGYNGWDTLDCGTTISLAWFGNAPAGHSVFTTGIDIPWIETWLSNSILGTGGAPNDFADCCCGMFDPSVISGGVSKYAYLGVGVGVMVADGGSSYRGTVTYHSQSAGIENMVIQEIVTPAVAANPVIGCEDRPIFNGPINTYPSTYYGAFGTFGGCWSLDTTPDGTLTVALINSSNKPDQSGYSTDGGVNWITFANAATSTFNDDGGNICVCEDGSSILIVPGTSAPLYSTNLGATAWTSTTAGSNPLPANNGYTGGSRYNLSRVACADRVDAKTFYVHNFVNNKLYISTDGGANWSVQITSSFLSQSGGWLAAQPLQAGYLWYNSYAGDVFKRSIDHGQTFSDVAGFTFVARFGFGKEAPGSSWATIFAFGTRSSVTAMWQSIDNGGTWQAITSGTILPYYPQTVEAVTMKCLAGDMKEYGRVYFGTHGTGVWTSYIY